MSKQISKVSKFGMVVSNSQRMAFDFVGEIEESNEQCVKIRNPLTMIYEDNNILTMLPLYMPIGLVDVVNTDPVIEVPKSCVSYIVYIEKDESNELFRRWNSFFTEAANLEEAPKPEEVAE